MYNVGNEAVLDVLRTLRSSIDTKLTTRQATDVGTDQYINQMYMTVATVSRSTKDAIKDLAVHSAKLQQRRAIATAFLNNNAGDASVVEHNCKVFHNCRCGGSARSSIS